MNTMSENIAKGEMSWTDVTNARERREVWELQPEKRLSSFAFRVSRFSRSSRPSRILDASRACLAFLASRARGVL